MKGFAFKTGRQGGLVMKEMTSRLLALALTASLVLSGCGGTAAKDDDTAKAPDTKTEEKKEEQKNL